LAEVSLSDLVEIAVGGLWGSETRTEKENTPVRVIRGVDAHRMSQREFVNLPIRWVRANQLASRTLGIGDVVLEASGACGRSYVVRKTDINGHRLPLSFSNFSRRLIPNSKVDPTYLGYRLKQAYESDELASYVTGTAMPNLDVRSALTGLSIFLPPLPEQREIARILGALDDKIELNHRMSATLEATARALFQSWFVDFDPVRAKAEGRQPVGMDAETAALFPDSFEDSALGPIPMGWEAGQLSDLAQLNPEAWSNSNRPETLQYVDLSNTKWGRIESITPFLNTEAPSRAQRVLRVLDTIVGTVRPGNGSYALITIDGLTGSTGFAVLRPLATHSAEFVYLTATSAESIDVLTQLADGGAYPAVRPEVVAGLKVVIPSANVLSAFSSRTRTLFSLTSKNERQSELSEKVRDQILPRLLSGELRVGDIAA